ncbi:hypothetical protein Anapl_02150 [Anas platyrhynchos]|uniref:Uncharacterized protein n=1 Tax=Anas platyrhynchos TaxID=8839 RepID=R0L7L1_ANAPL|nr:hypothetical protein Anapl_02150 [Anas platyrhynchos]
MWSAGGCEGSTLILAHQQYITQEMQQLWPQKGMVWAERPAGTALQHPRARSEQVAAQRQSPGCQPLCTDGKRKARIPSTPPLLLLQPSALARQHERAHEAPHPGRSCSGWYSARRENEGTCSELKRSQETEEELRGSTGATLDAQLLPEATGSLADGTGDEDGLSGHSQWFLWLNAQAPPLVVHRSEGTNLLHPDESTRPTLTSSNSYRLLTVGFQTQPLGPDCKHFPAALCHVIMFGYFTSNGFVCCLLGLHAECSRALGHGTSETEHLLFKANSKLQRLINIDSPFQPVVTQVSVGVYEHHVHLCFTLTTQTAVFGNKDLENTHGKALQKATEIAFPLPELEGCRGRESECCLKAPPFSCLLFLKQQTALQCMRSDKRFLYIIIKKRISPLMKNLHKGKERAHEAPHPGRSCSGWYSARRENEGTCSELKRSQETEEELRGSTGATLDAQLLPEATGSLADGTGDEDGLSGHSQWFLWLNAQAPPLVVHRSEGTNLLHPDESTRPTLTSSNSYRLLTVGFQTQPLGPDCKHFPAALCHVIMFGYFTSNGFVCCLLGLHAECSRALGHGTSETEHLLFKANSKLQRLINIDSPFQPVVTQVSVGVYEHHVHLCFTLTTQTAVFGNKDLENTHGKALQKATEIAFPLPELEGCRGRESECCLKAPPFSCLLFLKQQTALQLFSPATTFRPRFVPQQLQPNKSQYQ